MVESHSNDDKQQNPYEPPIAPPVQTGPRGLIPEGLSVPLAIGLAVVILIALVVNLGMGISLLLISVPAYFRAAGKTFQKISQGKVPSTWERVLAFVASIMVVYFCAFAGAIACCVTCAGVLTVLIAGEGYQALGGRNDAIIAIALLVCGGIGILAAGYVFWLFWPGRKRK
jgi:hypothetical protein